MNSTGYVFICGTAAIHDRVRIACRLKHWCTDNSMIAAEHAAELETYDMHTATVAVPGNDARRQTRYLCCMHSACGQGSDMCTRCRPENALQRTTEQVPDLNAVASYEGMRKLMCNNFIVSPLRRSSSTHSELRTQMDHTEASLSLALVSMAENMVITTCDATCGAVQMGGRLRQLSKQDNPHQQRL